MKLSGVKAMFGKAMTIGLVAGAVALVAPAKAQAQRIGFGVVFGSSYHNDARRDYYEHERFEQERAAIAQREAWERHEQWERHERREQSERWGGGRAFDRDRAPGGYRNGYNTPQGYYGR